tara:strand:- start:165 stop:758 length:594 start_codon:yes stop_codon:yes gene_type:complete
MLVQLLLIGYVLNYIFDADNPWIIALVIGVMITVSAWIAIRPLQFKNIYTYATMLGAIGLSGLPILWLVSQIVLSMPRWFEPSIVVPIAGMIFANAMNTVSLAAERFQTEILNSDNIRDSQRVALQVAMIPQVNALLAVGLVALPGMMTGQILSGIDPLVAARYQMVVMCMIFGSGGLAAVLFLLVQPRLKLLANTE